MGIAERKEREKEQRRNDIIDAAEKVFFTKGFESSTMDDVAEKAELSKGTLYLYFSSKEDLHYAIVLRGMEKIYDLIIKDYDESLCGADNLLEMAKAYVRFSNEYTYYFNAIMRFGAGKIDKIDDEKKQRILGESSPLIFLINVIEKGQKDGSIRNDIDAPELAVILWSQMSGVLEFIVLRDKIIDLLSLNRDEMIMNHFKIVLEGLRNKK
ncbi:MAG: TetR/AcrR family transcriptional regulator [Marinilabiliales bacterium]